jgi:hypothetical protein
MKYWGYFAGKLLAAIALIRLAWPLVHRALLPKAEPSVYSHLDPMGHDMLYSFGAFGFCLAAAGLLYLIVLDQRYRCRTCARKLRMPVTRGSWARMLQLGRPHTEYICPYGHGTLKVPDLQITGKEPIDWAEHQDIWRELELLDTEKR